MKCCCKDLDFNPYKETSFSKRFFPSLFKIKCISVLQSEINMYNIQSPESYPSTVTQDCNPSTQDAKARKLP